jgi:hypothetical protein
MRYSISILLTAVVLLLTPKAEATGLILPLYGNTTAQFNAAIEAAKVVPVIAIINPDDGAGSRKDNFIAGKVAALKAAGALVGGYIATGYGGVALSEVKVHMDNYTKWYGVVGYFLDEMSDSNSKLNYYKTIKNYAAGKKQGIVGNPGTSAPAGYGAVTDVIITYEDPLSRGFANYTQPSWTASMPVTRMGAIVYSAGGNNMTAIIDRAITQRYGWVYVTDKNEPDPFGTMPSYFTAEATYLKTKNTK